VTITSILSSPSGPQTNRISSPSRSTSPASGTISRFPRSTVTSALSRGIVRSPTRRPTSGLSAGNVNEAMFALPSPRSSRGPRPNAINRTTWPTSMAPSTAATIATGVDTATSMPQPSVNNHSLRASLMRATTRPMPNSLLASRAIARLALSSPVAAIATSQMCISASSREVTSQASARNHSAPGTAAGW